MAGPTPDIRIAEPEDLDWLVEQHGVIYAAEFGFDGTFRDNIAEKVRTLVQEKSDFNRIWIGEVSKVRTASVAISERPGKTAFLNFVLVLPAGRRKGIARAMMDTALDHARRHGMTEVRLETYSCLEEARNLYRRFGFDLTEITPRMSAYGQTFDREFWSLGL